MRLKGYLLVCLLLAAVGIGVVLVILARNSSLISGGLFQLIRESAPATQMPNPQARLATPAAALRPLDWTQPLRAIRADFVDLAQSRAQVGPLEQQIRAAGFNLVSLGAGRPEWTYFKWAAHPELWSSEVKSTGIDFLGEDTARFGTWAYVDAQVDVLAPLYIQQNPQAAAISEDGIPSPNLVSTTELVKGSYGKLMLQMVEAIASTYPVNSISLNEIYYQKDGYGPDDLASYEQDTGRSDWPRRPDGSIATSDTSIGTWRSTEIGSFIAQARDIAHRYGKSLFVNVALNLGDPATPLLDYGQDLNLLQDKADQFIFWGFFNMENVPPASLEQIASFLATQGRAKSFFVLGLWNQDQQLVSAQMLSAALQAVQQGGMSNIWITPASLMDSAHFEALPKSWAGK